MLQTKIFYYYKLDTNNDLYINFTNLLKKVLKLLKAKKKLVILI